MESITFITTNRAENLVVTYKPLGSFLTWENGKYIAIDNRTGDAWTEEFKTLKAAVRWLNGQGPKEEYESN